jgi:hypothetical protein
MNMRLGVWYRESKWDAVSCVADSFFDAQIHFHFWIIGSSEQYSRTSMNFADLSNGNNAVSTDPIAHRKNLDFPLVYL